MISITKNLNFRQYFNVKIGGYLVDQVQGRGKALRMAKKLCKERDEKSFLFEGFIINKDEE